MRTSLVFAAFLLPICVCAQTSRDAPPTVDVNVTNDETSPVPVTVQNGARTIAEYRVVGFTTTKTTGDIETTDASGANVLGYSAMHRLCQVEVAANSRAATTSEYLLTPQEPGDAPSAWLIPTEAVPLFVPDSSLENEDWVAYDPATQSNVTTRGGNPGAALARLDCGGYTRGDNPNTGSVGSQIFGRVFHSPCSDPRPVACAAPVEVPVTP